MKTFLSILNLIFIGGVLISCGVKGDPVPPQTPPPIGRGKPSYSKATMTLPKKKMPEEKDWIEEDIKEEGVNEEN